MAIVKKVSFSGNPTTNDLSGRLRFEQGENRMVLFDGTVNRMVIGLVNGEVLIAISKPGEDVFEALGA